MGGAGVVPSQWPLQVGLCAERAALQEERLSSQGFLCPQKMPIPVCLAS